MKPKANVAKLEEPEDDGWQTLRDLIKKQAELDKKLQLLVIAVMTTGE